MSAKRVIVIVSLAIVAILTTTGNSYAQGVGNLSSLPTLFTTPVPPTGWVVSDPATGGPVPVVLDPTGPVWGKSFTGPNGGNFLYPPTSPSNPALPVTELLQVAGTNPWTDWHEDVIGIDAQGFPDPGWTWANPFVLVNGLPAPGLTVTGVGTSNLSFFFNPVAPGSTITIRKDLVYAGTPGAAFFGTLAVHEYPTPEPASLVLLAAGALWSLRRLR
ncbi:MAG TPA: PEP-CTERM sorting domain-containing protein [Phycisphaerae bacterium]|nr:PEP-CTERM sorting domain-containing protein [Phycisphaerae bacterium]